MNTWKSERKVLIFLKLPFHPFSAIRSAKVTSNFNILLVATDILCCWHERCHVMIYWAAFSAFYLRILQCVTCRGEGLAELLQAEWWVPMPGHSQEVFSSPAWAAWAARLEKSPVCFSLPWSFTTKSQTQNLGKYLLSEAASQLQSKHCLCSPEQRDLWIWQSF